MSTGTTNLLWARAIVDALAHSGVTHVCLSPGARCAALAVAVDAHPSLRSTVHVDERSGAYFALGHARATGRAVALVCTSGTAAANYLPAFVEAHYARLPLVALTADRPPELRDTGAWQAIDQSKLYGRFVKWSVDLGVPEPGDEMLRYARNVAARAVAAASAHPKGPVHLNVPFREPLLPTGPAGVLTARQGEYRGTTLDRATIGGATGEGVVGEPDASVRVRSVREGIVAAPTAKATVDDRTVRDLAVRIHGEPRGLIIAGALEPVDGYPEAVARLASLAGYPVLADPTSGLRYGAHDRGLVVSNYDAVLRVKDWADGHAPRFVLRFGASPTSKHVASFLVQHPETEQVVIDPHGTWDDPTRLATERLVVDALAFAESLSDALADTLARTPADTAGGPADGAWPSAWQSAWPTAWLAADAAARASLDDLAESEAASRSVVGAYRALSRALPERALLYAANSMAVRDVDSLLEPSDRRLLVLANRGAAGIDGTLSSALGAALGSGLPTVLVTGDLAFAHDVNGLAASREDGIRATILVLNDGGGGIFAHLPLAELDPSVFERLFVTPSGLDVAGACAGYGVDHVRVDRATELDSLIAAADEPGVRVAEFPVDREANTRFHRDYWAAVRDALDRAG